MSKYSAFVSQAIVGQVEYPELPYQLQRHSQIWRFSRRQPGQSIPLQKQRPHLRHSFSIHLALFCLYSSSEFRQGKVACRAMPSLYLWGLRFRYSITRLLGLLLSFPLNLFEDSDFGFHPDSLFGLVIKRSVDAADVQVDFHEYLGRIWYLFCSWLVCPTIKSLDKFAHRDWKEVIFVSRFPESCQD